MPLSDHEQRILDEIEKNLLSEDRSSATRTKDEGGPAHRDERKRARWGALCFLAGFLSLFVFFYTGIVIVGVLAFAAMVGGIVLIAGALRSLGSPAALLRSPADRFGKALAAWEERMRQRYKKD